ncbi:sensor histidine kinase [Variovorax sp. RA8]|uniref:sensor histidine kinase n=1 Tax=Variovorax sp. (strain JCM 16519 / RA8) TaxID=662548 RepID=UPI0013A554AF|nr:HAMP domain-containing sensor histidine kinase [Variovorax sp. RA8]
MTPLAVPRTIPRRLISEAPGAANKTERPAIATVQAPRQRTVTVDPAAESAARQEFIRQSLMNRYIDESRGRITLGAIICMAMAGIAIGSDVPAWQAMAWLVVALAGNLIRYLAENKYACTLRKAPAIEQFDYIRRIAPIYLILAFVWGCSTLLFFGRMSSLQQFASWSLLAAMLYAPMARLSLIPCLFRRYVGGMVASSLLCITWMVWGGGSQGALLWVVPVALGQLLLAFRIAGDNHQTQADHYGCVFDLAAQKRAADDAVKAKNRFLAAAAHDMRQPVIALSLYAEYLESYPDSHVEVGPKITQATAAVNNLFNSLFDLAHFDTGEVKLTIEPVRIAEVIDGLAHVVGPVAKASGIELRVRVNDALLQTDSTRLRRMIANVLSNAVRYSKPGAKILLAARVRQDKLRVEVWDQGVGIAADKLPKVFSEFYRVDTSTALAPEGMGIGLSLVARLAEALNTKITIASVEGRGTRVTMEIGDVDPDPEKRRIDLALG